MPSISGISPPFSFSEANSIFKMLMPLPEIENYQSALACLENNEQAKALKFFRKSLEHNTNFFPSMMEIAIIYEENGDFKRAEKLYARSIQIFPDNYDLLIYYSSCLVRNNKFLKSLKYLRIAANLEPDLPMAPYYKSCVYFYNANRPKLALKALRVLHSAFPTYTPILLTMAEIYRHFNKPWLSLLSYRRAYKIDPENKEVLLALIEIYYNHYQNFGRAASFSMQLLHRYPSDSEAKVYHAMALNSLQRNLNSKKSETKLRWLSDISGSTRRKPKNSKREEKREEKRESINNLAPLSSLEKKKATNFIQMFND